jgi:exosortase/archaeosortase family protein
MPEAGASDGAAQQQLPPQPPGRDPWLRFALTFGALALLSEVVYYGVALESGAFRRYLEILAEISGVILSRISEGIQVRGTLITGKLFSVEIARGCDAYRICALLAAAMLAFPARWRDKLIGLALGLLWLNSLNFVRIVGLYLIGGLYYPEFHRAHVIYFPVFLIAATVAAWIVWVRWVTRNEIVGRAAAV